MVYKQINDENVGVIRIRARATVGILGMPESEADLPLLLDQQTKYEEELIK